MIPNFIVRNSKSQNPKISAYEMLGRSDIDWPLLGLVDPELVNEVPTPVKLFLRSEALYKDQINTHKTKITNARKDEHLSLPENIDYDKLPFLSREETEKLKKFKPQTLGQVVRLEGITPASLVLLHAMCRTHKKTLAKEEMYSEIEM
eukprot:TRINITY_DN2724_c0_g1_i1.p1 TRINITY_DN2724_c0_g1~~TRINITY_DN2724_c0_g1_i1.p1  ORF type:complete len:148 (-),score=17.63 TRINITY_DN2724_c0_g1_i1:66-509(-)